MITRWYMMMFYMHFSQQTALFAEEIGKCLWTSILPDCQVACRGFDVVISWLLKIIYRKRKYIKLGVLSNILQTLVVSKKITFSLFCLINIKFIM